MMESIRMKKSIGYEARQLTLRDMLTPLFRHRRVVIVTFCAIFALAIFYAWVWANGYYATTMQVVVSRERSNPMMTGLPSALLANDVSVVSPDEVDSEVALLQGRDMLQETAQICNLTKRNASLLDSLIKPDSRDLDGNSPQALAIATNSLAGELHVEAQKASRIIDVRYRHQGNPETAACVLQTLGKLYLEKHLRLQRPLGAFDFFAAETEKYQHALADSENRLVNFSKSEGVAAPDILRTDMAQQMVTAQVSLYQARQRIAADEQRIENLRRQMAATPSRSSTAEASISANILLQQLQSSLLAAEIKKTQLLTKYDPSYPLVKEADEEIAQTKEAIKQADAARYVNTTTDRDPTFEYLRQDEARTEADLASEHATAAALQASIHAMQSDVVSLDEKAVKQAGLLREAKANEENYLLYLTKREQERTSDALDAKRIANVAIAVPATVPVLPAHNPFSTTIVGFLLAILGGVGAGYLAELVDPSFHTPSEVEELLNIKVLAAVPQQSA
jgi:uncharacterized protein involved in exopolysaccharide biosynthesis